MTTPKDDTKAEARRLIDQHVGKQLVTLRLAAGQNQSDVARVLGLTFQQIQKYERGSNRISASVLAVLADHFGVPVGRFFEGREDANSPEAVAVSMGQSKHGQALWTIFNQMDAGQQRTLLQTAKAFVPTERQAAA